MQAQLGNLENLQRRPDHFGAARRNRQKVDARLKQVAKTARI